MIQKSIKVHMYRHSLVPEGVIDKRDQTMYILPPEINCIHMTPFWASASTYDVERIRWIPNWPAHVPQGSPHWTKGKPYFPQLAVYHPDL